MRECLAVPRGDALECDCEAVRDVSFVILWLCSTSDVRAGRRVDVLSPCPLFFVPIRPRSGNVMLNQSIALPE